MEKSDRPMSARKKIMRLVEQGHTDHCAKRIVWGDGECECGLDQKRESESS